jgi:hypothetical protein
MIPKKELDKLDKLKINPDEIADTATKAIKESNDKLDKLMAIKDKLQRDGY